MLASTADDLILTAAHCLGAGVVDSFFGAPWISGSTVTGLIG
ncbi:hypothetical protein [Mycolicibacterium austroafricanum]|nr:hypothetical protein [Mycolicibacterium austroafricanum]